MKIKEGLKSFKVGAGVFLLLLIFNINAFAEVKLPALFTNNMVLQQKSEIAIWGWSDPGEQVEISGSWNKKVVKVKADSEGNWKTVIPTTRAGGPYVLTVKAANTIRLENVLLGEVWLCSGQSNMNFPMHKVPGNWRNGVLNYEEEIAKADYPNIRLFAVPQRVSGHVQKDTEGEWEVCSPETVADFSAVAYYFAREITKETGFPVGLIHSSWGGTPAEAWTKKEVLEADPDFHPILERYNKVMQEYAKEMSRYQTEFAHASSPPAEPENPQNNKSPTVLYNAMIAPLVPYTVKGVIWYQGESNAERAYQYRKLLPAMINSWRQDWNKELPFYFVQIAPHKGQNPEIREAQFLTYQTVPRTGMVVITDHGDASDIHPRNKKVVGERLALWALAKDYGKKKIVYSGPLYKSMQQEGNKIRVSFDHIEGGLRIKEGEDLTGFAIAGADQQFYPAKAEIEGKTIIVWSEKVNDPVAVRFGWENVPEASLFNAAGLPASPFRTDSWPGETIGNK